MMRTRVVPRLLLLILAALALPAAPSAAEDGKAAVEILEYGLYATGPRRHTPAPGQLSGEQWTSPNIRLLERTDVIPGHLGRVFGFRFRVNDPRLSGKVLRLRIVHPRLKAPSGRSGTETGREEMVASSGQEKGYYFAFEYSWEIAEGDWTFQVLDGDRVLAEKKFRVIVPMF